MSLQSKTIDELFDLELERYQSFNEEENNNMFFLIPVYKELYRRLRHDTAHEYYPSLPMIKEKLVRYLVRYGSYLKTQYRKDDKLAAINLKAALRYEHSIPIAHYRLGFLSYKHEDYSLALINFQNAVRTQERCDSHEYTLTKQQMYNAQLYLSNSALYIAESAKKSLRQLEPEADRQKAPELELSPLYEIINSNERDLEANAFTLKTSEKEWRCSREECEDIAVEPCQGTIILYIGDREISLIYNEHEINLSIMQAEILGYLLLKSSRQNPARRQDFSNVIGQNERNGEVLRNTFTQNIRRLRRKMTEIGIPESVITKANREAAYFYTRKESYLIMYRTDNEFIIGE